MRYWSQQLFHFPMLLVISTGMYTGMSRPPVILYLFSYNHISLHFMSFVQLLFLILPWLLGVCFPILSKMSADLSFIVFASFLSSPSICSHHYPAFHRVHTANSLFLVEMLIWSTEKWVICSPACLEESLLPLLCPGSGHVIGLAVGIAGATSVLQKKKWSFSLTRALKGFASQCIYVS